MPRTGDPGSLVHVVVTPRFEVFYALQALESGLGEKLHGWRAQMDSRLPARLKTTLAAIAPTPLLWPLLADSLREAPPSATFIELLGLLRSMDDRTFQTFVLSGAFKSADAVDKLVSGGGTLARTVSAAVRSDEKLLRALGLHPFSRSSRVTATFQKIVTAPAEYRAEVIEALESFWALAFSDTWQKLEPVMRDRAQQMRTDIARRSFGAFAADEHLPVTTDGDSVFTVKSGTRNPVTSAAAIYVLPSVFNVNRLWATYVDARGRTRFFIPVFDATLAPGAAPSIDAALVFKALGDTTRYAIASTLARTPMTSVELARLFAVSKPTISHHVSMLRSAGLIEEKPGEGGGIVLSLNRYTLERASTTAVREMFSDTGDAPVVRRTRKPGKR